MISYSGRAIFPSWTDIPDVPTDVGPSIEDIAVGLGRTVRWRGGTVAFYSVLCHSLVAGTVAHDLWPEKTMLARWLRLHDAHETVLSDRPTTWKDQATREAEAEIDLRVALEHGLEPLSVEDYDLLKHVDEACLIAEAHALGHCEADKWWPRQAFDDVAELALRLTAMQLTAGNPVRYLEPRNSIPAFKRALQA